MLGRTHAARHPLLRGPHCSHTVADTCGVENCILHFSKLCAYGQQQVRKYRWGVLRCGSSDLFSELSTQQLQCLALVVCCWLLPYHVVSQQALEVLLTAAVAYSSDGNSGTSQQQASRACACLQHLVGVLQMSNVLCLVGAKTVL